MWAYEVHVQTPTSSQSFIYIVEDRSASSRIENARLSIQETPYETDEDRPWMANKTTLSSADTSRIDEAKTKHSIVEVVHEMMSACGRRGSYTFATEQQKQSRTATKGIGSMKSYNHSAPPEL